MSQLRKSSSAARVLPHLERLRVFVPEKHDLVLMKAVRGYEHDLEAALQIHANSPLDLETLVGRFQDEMTPIGDPVRIRGNFLHLIDSLFPDAADEVARRLGQGRGLPLGTDNCPTQDLLDLLAPLLQHLAGRLAAGRW
jgi:hypothetical protein